MDSRSQNDSDGGGGHHGGPPPPATSRGSPHDEGPPQTREAPPDLGPINGQLAVRPLDQIRISGSCNEYTEGPTAAPPSPASPGCRSSRSQETRDERPNNLLNRHPWPPRADPDASLPLSEGPGAEDSQGSARTSAGSTSSSQRLIGEHIVRSQPKRGELTSEELKPLNEECRAVASAPGGAVGLKPGGKHSHKCESCGRCVCGECTRPRALPSCWMCGRRCVCSAHSAVEYGTCVCCVKGLFYHCSSDDEDTCAEKPFSCSQSHCCVRWAAASLLALLFPCLLCYLPAKGCVSACQSCHDRLARPGCRCENAKPLGGQGVATET